MDWLDGILVGTIMLAAASLLAWRLLPRPPPKAPQAEVVLKGALSEGLVRAQRKQR
jgi:hypothetical protein